MLCHTHTALGYDLPADLAMKACISLFVYARHAKPRASLQSHVMSLFVQPVSSLAVVVEMCVREKEAVSASQRERYPGLGKREKLHP